MFNTVCVLGLGYVGLPTAALIARSGSQVIGVDTDPLQRQRVRQGDCLVNEPGLREIVHEVFASKRLSIVAQPQAADVYIIAVPTPLSADNKPDLTFVYQAARDISSFLKKGDLIILESTVPVGTTEKLQLFFSGKKVHLCHSPERILPGSALKELVENDRVIGGLTPACSDKAERLYAQFTQSACHKTSLRCAELTKLSENAFRDLNVAFANELSLICEQADVDVTEMIRLANQHPRVGILQPGIGVGGHCVAVDPWFLVDGYPEQSALIRKSRQVNQAKTDFVLSEVMRLLEPLSNSTVACLGLTYKPDVSDCRMSPALEIVRRLSESFQGQIQVVEPNLSSLPDCLKNKKQVRLVDLSEAIDQATAVLILVGHKAFQAKKRALRDHPFVIDRCYFMRYPDDQA